MEIPEIKIEDSKFRKRIGFSIDEQSQVIIIRCHEYEKEGDEKINLREITYQLTEKEYEYNYQKFRGEEIGKDLDDFLSKA